MVEIEEIFNICSEMSLNYDYSNHYNPMELFYERTSEKEICHSIVLADLLSPKGRHGCGDSFLRNFQPIQDLGVQLSTVNIKTERKVNRVKTVGAGERRIDILIEWVKNGRKKAIIIENKLNNATFQEQQVEDYKAALEAECYDVVKCVIISDNIESCEKSDYLYLYCKDIVCWIEKTLDKEGLACKNVKDKAGLYSYINILEQKAYKSDMKMDAKKLLELEDSKLNKIKNLVDCYRNSFISELISNTKDIIGNKIKDKDLSYMTPKGNYLQIWNEDAYKRNKLWVEVWFYDKQIGDKTYEDNAEIWIVSDNINEIDKINPCFKNYIQYPDDKRYYHCESNYTFNYLKKISRNKMHEEIKRLLEIITFQV